MSLLTSSRRTIPVPVTYATAAIKTNVPAKEVATDVSASDAANAEFVFKVVDPKGDTHRIKSSSTILASLLGDVAAKMQVKMENLVLKYVDDEQDTIALSSDSSLLEAVEFAQKANMSTLKLQVEMIGGDGSFNGFISKPSDKRNLVVGGGLVLATGALVGLFSYLRGKK